MIVVDKASSSKIIAKQFQSLNFTKQFLYFFFFSVINWYVFLL